MNIGLILGFKPDKMIIHYKDEQIVVKNVLVGIYEKKLFKSKKYEALIGAQILNGEDIKNEYFENIKV